MKKNRSVIPLLLTLVLLFSLTACAKDEPPTLPSQFEKLASVMLLPKEESLKALGLSESDLVKNEYRIYETGRTVDFCGSNFHLGLGISKCDPEGTDGIYYFEYTAILQDDKRAAEVVSAVAKKFTEAYGRSLDPNQNPDKFRLAEASVEELQSEFETYEFSNTDYWCIQELTSERTVKFAEMIAKNSILKPHDKAYLELQLRAVSSERGVEISIIGSIDLYEFLELNKTN